MISLLLCLVNVASSEYVPGTPGGPWTREELLVVRAQLWKLFTDNTVAKYADYFLEVGLPKPVPKVDLSMFAAKVLRLRLGQIFGVLQYSQP